MKLQRSCDIGLARNPEPRRERRPTPAFYCDCCEEGIYIGDEYYDLMGSIYCEDCVNKAHQWSY